MGVLSGSLGKFSLAAFAAVVLAAGAAHADDAARPPLRYASQEPPNVETVTVTGLRPALDTDYKLGPSDKVRVTVYNEEDLSGEFQIDGSGYVRLPLIGQIRAAGLSAHQLEAQVEGALDSGYLKNPRVNIEVSTYRPFYIGQVTRPGEYPYVSNMSALNAIALAGGYTDKAVESTLYVRHEGETREHPVQVDELTRIYPGDVVRVSETAFWTAAEVLSPLTTLLYAVRP
jgi:polysaccharide export outer membrane protein